jgi:hypothetical protein
MRSRLLGVVAAAALVVTASTGAAASSPYPYRSQAAPLLTFVNPGADWELVPIIDSGTELEDGFTFSGIPDGIGAMPGPEADTVDVFVNHEESHVPFLNLADLQDASVSRLTLDTDTGEVLAAEVALDPSLGFLRFCSATMAGPNEGLDRYVFLTNEETNDVVSVPADAPYTADPATAPDRQGGYAVALDPSDDSVHLLAGAGRHNHENDMVIPGGWDQIAVLSGDDTFFTTAAGVPTQPQWSQLYLSLTNDEEGLLADEGTLWAFRVTATDEGKVDAADAFNGANDYGDIGTGDHWQGRFIRVPENVARGLTAVRPQEALENWSNAHNVFQFIRVEDTAYDPNDRRVVYLADTGDGRMVPDPATGRLTRGPSGTPGAYPNGRVYRLEFDPDNPRRVDDFSILLNADLGGRNNPAVLHQPDNLGTSANSLMVQEDTSQLPGSRVWRYDLATQMWTVVAAVQNGTANESSGIVDASEWFGDGAWLLDVQQHDTFVESQPGPNGVTLKREGGQLLLLRIPGS